MSTQAGPGASLVVHTPPPRRPGRSSARAKPIAPVRVAVRLLDLAPWPLGEWACGFLFLLRNAARPSVVRRAVAWLSRFPGRAPARLAATLFVYQGRFRARHALIGLRTPGALAARVRIDGREHLRPGGAILLGFLVGPPAVGEALCASGIEVMSVAGPRYSPAWEREDWKAVRALTELSPLTQDASGLGGTLYRMRRRLADGQRVYIAADGVKGRVAFTLQVHDSRVLYIKSGWLTLVSHTGVPVIPVTSHDEGATQVVTLHPPLPAADTRSVEGLAQYQAQLQAMLDAYAAAHPAQCSGLVYSY